MNKALLLSEIAKKIEDCRRCDLWNGTTHAVPGEGLPEAKVVFIGEGPGFHEDRLGRPFVGQAGKLLDKLIVSVGLSRDEVFICNVVKHRAPENRDPLPTEIAACKVWLDQQLEIINPKVTVTLGRYSLARFLPRVKISTVHGQAIKIKSQVVIPMYHPAAALRNGAVLRSLEADFQKNSQLLKNPDNAVSTAKLNESEEDPNQMSFF
ncbi:MAG: uracil-DNA glycosylase [Candidatus Woykebacteria bacterium]